MKALLSRLSPALCLTAMISAACATTTAPRTEPRSAVATAADSRQGSTLDDATTPVEVDPQPTPIAPAADGVATRVVRSAETTAPAPILEIESFVEQDLPDSSPQQQLEEALDAYESSRVFWQQGNFDDAFAALDRAYELMTSASIDEDSLLSQQKEDLRHLISRRIVDIYSSRRTVVSDYTAEIPLTINEDVQREIESFQGAEREFFLQSYRRSGLYRPMILAKLAAAGMPADLSWLPLVESGFKVKALSRARALGLWQFIASTGYRYDLHRTEWIDERMDPEKATDGAIAYLWDLHGMFGDWTTALAGYNCGEHNVQRQIRSQKAGYFDQFWDLYQFLPRETRRYVPRFLATLAIVKNPAAYGMELPEPLPPLQFDTIEVRRSVTLAAADEAMSLEKGTLAALNPELRHGATPNEPYALKVPAGNGQALLARFDSLPKFSPSAGLGVHRVRSGETLSAIARRYNTSVAQLMRLNNLRSANRIWPGQRLTVGAASATRSIARTPVPAGSAIDYSVQQGDSLWLLASRFGTTVDRLKRDNNLSGNGLQVAQKLIIRGSSAGSTTASAAGRATYQVRRGDTLSSIARRLQVRLDALMQINGLSRRSTIYPGQILLSP